jgi:polysaccharide biosynthesis protein PslH
MKILMLTPYLPYPTNSGGQIRSNNLIKQLSKKHQITLCSLIKNPDDAKYKDKLEPYCKNVYIFHRPQKVWTLSNILKTGFSLYPFLVMRNFSIDEKKSLPKIIEEGNFDLIHAETFYTCPHIPRTNLPLVLVDQTIEYQAVKHYVDTYRFSILKPLLYIDVLKLKFWEMYYWKKATQLIGVSEQDVQVMKYLTNKKVELVRNGVGDDFTDDVSLHYNKTIIFQGNYEWLQNGEAARILAKEVFPLVLKEIPDATLIISGQNTNSVSNLQSENIILNELAVDDITGVQKAIRTAGIMIAPLYGPGGTRLKILSSMAARLPVVTTKVGIAGVGENGVHYLEGETSEELAKQAVRLLKDKKMYKKIADNARKLVETEYFYDSIAKKLNEIYERAVNKND